MTPDQAEPSHHERHRFRFHRNGTDGPVTGSGPILLRQPPAAVASPPEQLHLQFGADAARQLSASWVAPERVGRPRLWLGTPEGGLGSEVEALERTYVEALTGQRVFTYHARLHHLQPDTSYIYQACHPGAAARAGSFRTAPSGRAGRLRFTAFGDQSVPSPVGLGLGPWSPHAGHVVDAVEALDPLFHLVAGDLSYANLSDEPVETWRQWCNNAMRSARNRPWMPCAGNHENEVGNGPHGYLAYQTRFDLPMHGIPSEFGGNWYAFTAGSVRVVCLNNDDVCLQDGGFSCHRRDHMPGYKGGANPYIRGYSGGAQRLWLERTLAAAQQDPEIDWTVVCMHQVAMSSAHFNGADLGIRQEWLPLFDRYGVDLVLAGHEHHFERTFPVRGVLPPSSLLTPAPQGSDPDILDTSRGTVHLTLGGGGHPSSTQPADFDQPAQGVVITGVGPGDPGRQHPTIVRSEPAPWSAYRDVSHPYGFAAFDVDPDAGGDLASITVTYYAAQHGSPDYQPVDTCVLRKPRRRWTPVREVPVGIPAHS